MKTFWLFILLIGSLLMPQKVYADKVAVIISPHDTDDRQWNNELTNMAVNILEEKGYRILWIERGTDVRLIIADRIILIFMGHSNMNDRNELWATWGLVNLDEIVNHLYARELIMFTNTCGGGIWLDHAKPGRFIVSAVNDTKAIMEVYYDAKGLLDSPTPNIVNFLELSIDNTVENSYILWRELLIDYYNLDIWSGHYSLFKPVMYDGIAGDVYL